MPVYEAAAGPGHAVCPPVRLHGALGPVTPGAGRYTDADAHAHRDASGHGYTDRHCDRHSYVDAQPDSGGRYVDSGAAHGHGDLSAGHRNQDPNSDSYPDRRGRSDPTAGRRSRRRGNPGLLRADPYLDQPAGNDAGTVPAHSL